MIQKDCFENVRSKTELQRIQLQYFGIMDIKGKAGRSENYTNVEPTLDAPHTELCPLVYLTEFDADGTVGPNRKHKDSSSPVCVMKMTQPAARCPNRVVKKCPVSRLIKKLI